MTRPAETGPGLTQISFSLRLFCSDNQDSSPVCLSLTLYEASLINKAIRVGRRAPNDAKWLTSLGTRGSEPGLRSVQYWHQPPGAQTMMTEKLSLMFYFYQILISIRARDEDHHQSPLFLFPAPTRDLASSWSDRDTAEEISGASQAENTQSICLGHCLLLIRPDIRVFTHFSVCFPPGEIFHSSDSWLLKSN